ncbi:exodeoxyribonuclease VII large subunit [Nocardioides nitrophenolicus]|uniref:exodeoxyribonuclease VII large subunit n=1 Tax=Nocardioides nitrophenolicus TaxID=60489 RepID=UPI00195C6FFD|nr:exodeoxyribonuclease VII large subunit [Nocardioides nitrophenolicus]MBM7518894.1 exodeoxyribonuclease VII large subunit [Nocardioides nitrophenolicus]
MALETSLEKPAPVRAIANALAGWIDRLGAVWVEGQVTQISRRPGLATVFMTLRDSVADISVPVTCSRVMFDGLPTPVTEGASVVIHARPSYYANRGSLSLNAREIRMVGLGELLARLERRRQLLAAEGLFAQERKRRLPAVPRRVGLVTAPNSAAERDVLDNATRRWPAVSFTTAYAAMQGQRSAEEVIEAVRRLDADPEVDVIVVARGGGSVEDLLPFSDEGLIRVVAAARTPVVSAIGHEPDSPLLDLVADVRASTPTDAAKLIVPDMAQERLMVDRARDALRRAVRHRLDREQAQLDTLRSRPALAHPGSLVDTRLDELDDWRARIRRQLEWQLDRAADDLDHRRARVRALSPLATLRRGYAVLQDADGHVVTTVAGVAADAALTVRVADGRIHVTATTTEEIHD